MPYTINLIDYWRYVCMLNALHRGLRSPIVPFQVKLWLMELVAQCHMALVAISAYHDKGWV
jgi:hypothetical protein